MLLASGEARETNQSIYDGWVRSYSPGQPVRVDLKEATGLNSATDRYTHRFHPYPAKLLGAIPSFFLRCPGVAERGARLLDPFCGSGTVLVEGMAGGLEVVGCDVNPLARLITAAKTTTISPDRLSAAYDIAMRRLPSKGKPPPVGPIRLERWFAPKVARQISRLVQAVDSCEDLDAYIFMAACLSVVIHRKSLTDPTISVPVKLDAGRPGLTDAQRSDRQRWLNARKQADVFSLFHEVFRANSLRLARLAAVVGTGSRATLHGDVRSIPEKESIDLVITSPPYGSAQKYVRSTSLSLQWLGLIPTGLRAIERQTIGREHFATAELSSEAACPVESASPVLRTIREKNPMRAHIAQQFLSEMTEALERIDEAVRPGGTIILIMGDNMVCGEPFKTSQYLAEFARGLGLVLEVELLDRIKSRGLITRRASTAGVIADEWIGVFRKPQG